MLSVLFQSIYDKIKSEKLFDDETLLKALEHIQGKRINSYVWPEDLIEKLGISEKESFRLLATFSYHSIVKQVYKLFCPVCGDVSYKTFESLNEIEHYQYCNDCGKDLLSSDNPNRYIILLYKVKKNETT
jgi:hypothetical protein